MSIKDEYLSFRNEKGLRPEKFDDRVELQLFLRDRLPRIWNEHGSFSYGGLFTNYMTGYAIGFAYYDCKPSDFCKSRCYGLPLSGLRDYYLLRLGVLSSEALKTGDLRYMNPLREHLRKKNLKILKIGHWGDAVLSQLPHIAQIADEFPKIIFWWYTRKKEIAIEANNLGLPNLKCYLSIDPTLDLPSKFEYPYGITYFLGDGYFHREHESILKDDRLVAIFTLKRMKFVEDPALSGTTDHPKLCLEKLFRANIGTKGISMCSSCIGRCHYQLL